MKTLIKIFLASSMVFSAQSFAFDHTDSLETVKQKLPQLDCSKDVDDCRYYSAIEHIAYLKACPVALNKKIKAPDTSKEDAKQIAELLDNWTAIQDPKIRQAIFAKSNPFRDAMEEMTLDYLHKIPINELSIECTRIGVILENKNPEDMSDILQGTKNYR